MSPALTSFSVEVVGSTSPVPSLPAVAVQLNLFNASTKPPALTSFFLSSSLVISATLPFGLSASLPLFTVSVNVSAVIFLLAASNFKPSPTFTSYLTVMSPLLSLLTIAVVALPSAKVTFVPDATVSKPSLSAAGVPVVLTLQPALFTASITVFAVTKPLPSSVEAFSPFSLPVTNLPSFSSITEVFAPIVTVAPLLLSF
uniref:Uncharacterized protein n=1 Tax=Haemophilus influenzae TaxID=727 RepID=A0AB37AZX5_HAEIF|nr:hypothetical protein BV056_01783 [Haemophilus influenzae]PRM81701.1 hypothetical protein BV055_01539 [Haemophilus influenzae]